MRAIPADRRAIFVLRTPDRLTLRAPVADAAVRPARALDAGEIGRIQLVTWQIGYATILPTEVLESMSADQAAAVWAATINQAELNQHVMIATEGDDTVGFVAAGPDPDPVDEDAVALQDATIAVATLLVEPRWGRRGHGSRLLAAIVDIARERGLARGVVWLPEDDTVSVAFFGSAGWAPDGYVRTLDTGSGPLREIRLHTDITGDPDQPE